MLLKVEIWSMIDIKLSRNLELIDIVWKKERNSFNQLKMEEFDLTQAVSPTVSATSMKMATLLCLQCLHLHGPPLNMCSSYFMVGTK